MAVQIQYSMALDVSGVKPKTDVLAGGGGDAGAGWKMR